MCGHLNIHITQGACCLCCNAVLLGKESSTFQSTVMPFSSESSSARRIVFRTNHLVCV
jgi:hypothetical protein